MALELKQIPLAAITERVDARTVKPYGVAMLAKKMEELGYLPQFPLLVIALDNGTYRLVDGAHRASAAQQAGLTEVTALIREPCATPLEEIQIARMANEASGTNVATTMVDHAELTWRLAEKKYTQLQIAEALGWSRGDVSHYIALRKLSADAWRLIATTFSLEAPSSEGESVAVNATDVASPFTEYLLRPILDLTAPQQFDLCQSLAKGEIRKGRFNELAEAYAIRNEAEAWLLTQLGTLDEDLQIEARAAIATGQYDKDWQPEKKEPGPKLQRLLEALRGKWEDKYAVRLLQGDFYTLIKDLGDASIDAVIVDPPYNISTDRVYTLDSQADWSKHFGDWDTKTDEAFGHDIACWATEYFRLMKPGASGFMFVGEPYLNLAQGLFAQAGFEIKGTFVWCRTNPGPSVTKADLMPAIDFAIQFVKPGGPRTFHYPGDADGAGLNWQRFPICGGKERLLDARKDTLHPTQKPEAVIWYLMELITVPGDLVLDGFMGTGTTAKVAKDHHRKFVGFEQDETYFLAAQRRLEM